MTNKEKWPIRKRWKEKKTNLKERWEKDKERWEKDKPLKRWEKEREKKEGFIRNKGTKRKGNIKKKAKEINLKKKWERLKEKKEERPDL